MKRTKKMKPSTKAKAAKTRRQILIPEWKKAWKLHSIQVGTTAAAILSAYGLLPDKLQDAIPEPFVIWLAVGLFLLVIVARLLKQSVK